MNRNTDVYILNVPSRKVEPIHTSVVISNSGFFPWAPSDLAPTHGPVKATITIAPEVAKPSA